MPPVASCKAMCWQYSAVRQRRYQPGNSQRTRAASEDAAGRSQPNDLNQNGCGTRPDQTRPRIPTVVPGMPVTSSSQERKWEKRRPAADVGALGTLGFAIIRDPSPRHAAPPLLPLPLLPSLHSLSRSVAASLETHRLDNGGGRSSPNINKKTDRRQTIARPTDRRVASPPPGRRSTIARPIELHPPPLPNDRRRTVVPSDDDSRSRRAADDR